MDTSNSNRSQLSEQAGQGQPTIQTIAQEQRTESNAIQVPEIALPKGGGALKGIDEKFEVNAANGTASFSIPLPVTPGRNGFSPSLSLSYNSGGGNGPFGLGWSLGYPSIQRKTDKQLPRYRDALAEDLFMFSGVEDLVPVPHNYEQDTVKRYQPRIEGSFARIEKISHPAHGTYWKVTTRENVATIFGRKEAARIADPLDAKRIFQWLPEFSYDDKGNWIQYEYKAENLDQVPDALFERNRKNGLAPFTNKYLKRVRYGNRKAYYADPDHPYDPPAPVDPEHFFELVFDYGEHDPDQPAPTETPNMQWDYRSDAFSTYRSGFEIRTNRRCRRVLMFHHFPEEKQFVGTAEEEDFGKDYLVKALQLDYQSSSINDSQQSETTYLTSLTQIGYIRKPDGSYSSKPLPPMEFSYQALHWEHHPKSVSAENSINAPVGLTNNYQWVDLYGEGISGILTEQGEGWFYKSNLGDVDGDGAVTFTPAQVVMPRPSFSGLSNGVLSLQDLAANGEKQVVVNGPGLKGYFELTADNNWEGFQAFQQIANINPQDPQTRLIDLNGDGQAELVVTEEKVFVWYPADGKKGYQPAEYTAKALDEERGPAIVFADQEQVIFLADMSGDGLTDIARIRNGEICYWANLGYGRFSAKVNMDHAPFFEHPELFNPSYLHLADVSGTGATDILYLGENKFKAYINLSGNAWSKAHEIDPFFPIDPNSKLSVTDLLGTGTSCIVWSSDLPSYANAPMRYIDLMGSKKPHVLTHYKNNLGKETTIHYKSSTHYYLQDKLAGKPWITKLPFPVQVVSKLVVEEKITQVRFSKEYRYHHGYYDHSEREFRGFGMVEQMDTEHFEVYRDQTNSDQQSTDFSLYQPPVLTKTWYHTGAFLDRKSILTHFKEAYWQQEYNRQFPLSPLSILEPELPDAQLSEAVQALKGDELREALRACKGMVLRQEIFALDADKDAAEYEAELKRQLKPYTVATHNCHIRLLQARGDNPYGIFLVTESEALSIHYEREESDPRIAHTLNTEFDELGNVLESASVVYGRDPDKITTTFQGLEENITDFSQDANDKALKEQLAEAFKQNIKTAKAEQEKLHIIYTKNSFAKYYQDPEDPAKNIYDIDLPAAYRTRLPHETKTFEITGLQPEGTIFQLSELQDMLGRASKLEYHEYPIEDLQRRLVEQVKTKYLSDTLEPLEFERYETVGLPHESYQLAFTPELVKQIYSNQAGTALQAGEEPASVLIEKYGAYTTSIDGNLWIRSGFTHFKEGSEDIKEVRQRFYSPIAFEDPLGIKTKVVYDRETFANELRNNDGYYLFIRETEDVIKNRVQIDIFNYRTLSPARMIDINANPSSILLDELGLVKAMAVEGNGYYKNGAFQLDKADDLVGLKEYSHAEEVELINDLFGSGTYKSPDTQQLSTLGNDLLQHATMRFIYNFDLYRDSDQAIVAAAISREEHFADNPQSKLQFRFEYSDGLGNVAMTKVQAEPGKACYVEDGVKMELDTGIELRWIGNGRTILNNKGKPVKQYEPYFSTNFFYETEAELVECGVTPILYYDALGRLMKTTFPNGTLARVEFDAWQQRDFDQNDTVLEKECTWYQRRTDDLREDYINDPKEQAAASKTQGHHNTPTTQYLDSLGRPILSIEHNGLDEQGKKRRLYTTFIQLDIEGNPLAVVDARGNTVMSYQYNILGHRLYQNSMDAGERWMLHNVMGNPIYQWDSRDQVFHFTYDNLQRPVSMEVAGGDQINEQKELVPLNHIYDHAIYGEDQENDLQFNLRGQVFLQYDTAGRIRNQKFDFKGNLLESSREFTANYKEVPNWIIDHLNNPSLFDPALSPYTTRIEYDALNRAIKNTTPDQSVTIPIFNEAGLLDQVKVIQSEVGEKVFVKNIDYDAKGQRKRIVYGDRNGNNLATTTYEYDPNTFRLTNLRTISPSGGGVGGGTHPQPKTIQNLHYTYDPVGNIIEVEDQAIPTKFFNNFKIEPKGWYTYDALYRLIEAQGKEHSGQAINFGDCDNHKDKPFLKECSPNQEQNSKNDMAWRNYTQVYRYDPVGNILQMDHQADKGKWKRTYQYETENNRLQQTQVGSKTYTYPHHAAHGFITKLPNLQVMRWNFKDELQAVATQRICTGADPETTYYVYDGNGQRVRKVTENSEGNKKEERLYLGGIEIYKKYAGNHRGLQRSTLHIMDDSRRIALIDTRNDINDETDQRTVRFQFSNHLESTTLELDDLGTVISYEEYHPFGTTAYRAVNRNIKAAGKRYRYTGKERDEETGLYYHGARYYICWLGRWCSADPAGLVDGLNIYSYVQNNSVIRVDRDGLSGEDVFLGGIQNIRDTGFRPFEFMMNYIVMAYYYVAPDVGAGQKLVLPFHTTLTSRKDKERVKLFSYFARGERGLGTHHLEAAKEVAHTIANSSGFVTAHSGGGAALSAGIKIIEDNKMMSQGKTVSADLREAVVSFESLNRMKESLHNIGVNFFVTKQGVLETGPSIELINAIEGGIKSECEQSGVCETPFNVYEPLIGATTHGGPGGVEYGSGKSRQLYDIDDRGVKWEVKTMQPGELFPHEKNLNNQNQMDPDQRDNDGLHHPVR